MSQANLALLTLCIAAAAEHHQRKRVLLVHMMSLYRHRMRMRHYITRESLLLPAKSPWRRLFESHVDGALVDTTGLTHKAFMSIHALFEKFFHATFAVRVGKRMTVHRSNRGRKPALNSIDALGLCLSWLNGTMREKHLVIYFAINQSMVSRYLNCALRALNKCLELHPAAAVTWPSAQQMQFYSEVIKSKEPHVKNIFGFVDGLDLPVFKPADPDEQNAMYSGYTCRTYAGCAIVWAPDGTAIWSMLNAPG